MFLNVTHEDIGLNGTVRHRPCLQLYLVLSWEFLYGFLNNNLLIKKYNYLGVWFLIFTWISDLYKEIKEPVLYVDISILPSESLDRFDLDFDLETRVLSLVFRFLKRKIIYDQARLNGGINYEYPGYNTVFSIDQFYSNFDLGT